MSDPIDETEGLGAADPITGVTAGHDDLADDAQLPDGDEDLASSDPESVRADSGTLAVNDAVAGETALPGTGDGNDGPTGGAPAETRPDLPENELDPASIDLDDEH